MYAMTAAHTTLPLPSYVRVTNLSNGKSVVLRVNDRGPFLSDRLIDLSYTAAYKLDVLDTGSAFVEVESILPDTFSNTQVAIAAPVPGSMSFPSSERTVRQPVAEQEPASAIPDLFAVLDAPREPAPQDTAQFVPNPSASSAGGIYLQLGAFSAYDNADSFVARMRAELPSLLGNLGIVSANGLFKVHAGPYPDHAVARQAADKIAQSLSIKPMLLTR